MSTNSTFFDGKKHWLAPMLLLLFAAVLGMVLSGDINTDGNHTDSPLSASEQGNMKPIEAGVYDGPRSSDQPILRVPTHGTIRGRITSADWAIWPSEVVVELVLIKNNSKIAQFACHREESNFIFEQVNFGAYRLKLVGDRILPFSIDVKLDAEATDLFQSMPLRNAASISGVVFDTAGNVAVNVQVVSRFQHELEGFYVVPQITTTDHEGRFTIDGVRPGVHKVFVGAEHSPLSKTETINISENSPEAFTQFTINKFGTASVFVNFVSTTANDSKRFKKLRVSAERLASDPTFSLSLDVNDQGLAQFNALPPGRYSFTVYGGSIRRTRYTAAVIEGKNSDVKIDVGKR